MHSAQTPATRKGRVLGFPLEGFSLFQGLLLSVAAALITFCFTTTVAIFSLLVWNLGMHHSVDFADSYRNVGFPAALIVLAVALPVFAFLWIRAKVQR